MKRLSVIVISLLLAVAMTLPAFAGVTETLGVPNLEVDDTFTLGDVDGSGSFNAQDAYAVKAYLAGVDAGISADSADLDADGAVTAKDTFYLKACLAGAREISSFDGEGAIYKFTIAGNPITDYDVVYDSDFVLNADNRTIAGSLIRTYIYKIFGFWMYDYIGEGEKPHHIFVKRLDPLAEPEERMNLGIEDYVYEVKNGDLYIYGTLRGDMYAVYEILEDYLGVRFYSDYETFIYKQRTVDMPEGLSKRHETKQVTYRFTGQSKIGPSYYYYFANRLNNTNINGGNDPRNGYLTGCLFDNAHSFASTYKLGTGLQYAIDNNLDIDALKQNIWNIFPLGNDKSAATWQPCASAYGEGSDYQIMLTGLKLIFECYSNMGYDIEYLMKTGALRQSFSMCDNTNGCSCKYCRAKYSGGTLKRVTQKTADAVLDGYTGDYTYDPDKNGGELTFKSESLIGTYVDFVGHAIRDMREIYPGITLWTILYDFSIPESIKPEEGLGIMYCGHGCLQHALGTDDCGDDTTNLGGNNNASNAAMRWWADAVHEKGGEIYFWSYGVNYSYCFVNTPCIYEMYQNYRFMLSECHFDGIFFEGCSYRNNFEMLKSYLSARMAWNPEMTWEEYLDTCREFLYMYYGSSDEIMQYIDLQQQAGDATGRCNITNNNRPWDFYSWQFLDAHYEEMRALLETALTKCKLNAQREHVMLLIYSCDFMGLSSAWGRLYLNGTPEEKALVRERYTALYAYFEQNPEDYHGDPYPFPEEPDYDTLPMDYFFDFGSWRPSLIPDFAKKPTS